MTKELEFYFDFISPYAYLAHKKIQSLPSSIRTSYKPILLGGLHNLEGITAPAFIKSKLKNMINDCNLVAKKFNFNFKWNDRFPLNSLNIMRGYFSVNSTVKDQYVNTMFDAYWKNNLDITDEKILITLLKDCKIDPDQFFETIKEQMIKDKLKEATKDAHEKGIFGAPTFMINNKIFWGQDRLEYALDEYSS